MVQHNLKLMDCQFLRIKNSKHQDMMITKRLTLLRLPSLILLLIISASCGFQLRGTGVMPETLEIIALDCEPVDAQKLCSIIRRQLAAENISVVEESLTELEAEPATQLIISSVDDKRRAASIARDASTAEIEFSRSVDFNIRSTELGDRTLEMTAKQFQTYQYTELSVLGKDKEEEEVKDNLNQRLATEILGRLASALALADEE
jgi:LPS-assembly lipoprotein